MKRWNQAIALILCAAILSTNIPWVAVVATANDLDSLAIDLGTVVEGEPADTVVESEFSSTSGSASLDTSETLDSTSETLGDTTTPTEDETSSGTDGDSVLNDGTDNTLTDTLTETQVDTELESDESDTEISISKTSLEDESDPVAEPVSETEDTTDTTNLFTFKSSSSLSYTATELQALADKSFKDLYIEFALAIYYDGVVLYCPNYMAAYTNDKVPDEISGTVNESDGSITITLSEAYFETDGALSLETLPSLFEKVYDDNDPDIAVSAILTVFPTIYVFDDTANNGVDDEGYATTVYNSPDDSSVTNGTYYPISSKSESDLTAANVLAGGKDVFSSASESSVLVAYFVVSYNTANTALNSDTTAEAPITIAAENAIQYTNYTIPVNVSGDDSIITRSDGSAYDAVSIDYTVSADSIDSVTATIYYFWREDGLDTVDYAVGLGENVTASNNAIDDPYQDYFLDADDSYIYATINASNSLLVSETYTLPSTTTSEGVTSITLADAATVTSNIANNNGFTFVGWDYNYFYNANDVSPTYNIIAVAVMERNSYDITYALGEGETFSDAFTDSEYGTDSITTTTTEDGERTLYTYLYSTVLFENKITVADLTTVGDGVPIPIKENYIFMGWEVSETYIDANGNSVAITWTSYADAGDDTTGGDGNAGTVTIEDELIPTAFSMPAGTVVLTPIWQPVLPQVGLTLDHSYRVTLLLAITLGSAKLYYQHKKKKYTKGTKT